jgi:hypothetical protein
MSEYMQKWEKTRREGKFKYILFQSLMTGGACFLTFMLFKVIFNTASPVGVLIYQSIMIGLVISIISWVGNEIRYKKYSQK